MATVTAGQIYFTTVEMQNSSTQGLESPQKILFELDELYIDDGAQILKVEEYEPEKFIALTWWTNKIYLFERKPNFLMNNGSVFKDSTRVVEPSFGISFQCVGMYKLPKTKSILILKLKEGLIMFDAESE